MRDEILTQLRAAVPVDAVVLGLQGAWWPRAVLTPRAIFWRGCSGLCRAGPPQPPDRQTGCCGFFAAFKEFPHTDFWEGAEDPWAIVVATLERHVRRVMPTFDCRMIDVFPTSREAMRSFVDRMIAIERDDAKKHGSALTQQLGQRLFENRGKHLMPTWTAIDAVATAISASSTPVVLADIWDTSRRRYGWRCNRCAEKADGAGRNWGGCGGDLGSDCSQAVYGSG